MDNKKRVMQYMMLLLTGVLLLTSGCHADIYYQAQAVERARKFLLAEAKDLNMEQMNFVRFNEPVILHAELLGSPGTVPMSRYEADPIRLTTELRQICVTWRIPGKENLYMVYGVSNGRMDFWAPERLIKKRFYTFKTPLLDMVAQARRYAVDNLYDELSVEEMNRLRFGNPSLAQTSFPMPKEKVASGKSANLHDFEKSVDNVAELEDQKPVAEKAGGKQYSLIWRMEKRDVVFSGRCAGDLAKWQIEFAGFMSPDEAPQRVKKVILTPEQIFDKLPVPDEKRPAAAVKEK